MIPNPKRQQQIIVQKQKQNMQQENSNNSQSLNNPIATNQVKTGSIIPDNNNPPLDLKNLLQIQLQQYDDLEEEEFQFVEDNFQEELRKAKEYQSAYMHQHSNVIPIGTNYQAIIPQLLPEEHYKIRSRQMIKRLFILKINDPQRLNQFIEKHQEVIKKYFEQFQLTEEDYSIMYNNYKQYGNQGDVQFQKYLEKTLIYWNKYFLGKQKIVAKSMNKKKKKRNKGSIPI